MEKVKILKPIYVEQTGIRYLEGDEAEVPKYLAERHSETGFMEIIVPTETVQLDKVKGK